MIIKEILRRVREAKVLTLRLRTLDYIGIMKIKGISIDLYPYTLEEKIRLLIYL